MEFLKDFFLKKIQITFLVCEGDAVNAAAASAFWCS
jgi:hypothetical protein